MNSQDIEVDQQARYLDTHEWARPAGPGLYTIGISRHAENALGDVVYVELPKVGSIVKKGQVFGVIESVKAASDLYSPVSGTVIAVNTNLIDDPSLANRFPYTEGWIVSIETDSKADFDSLLSPADYQKLL